MAKNQETTDANSTITKLCLLIEDTINSTTDWNNLLVLQNYTYSVNSKITQKMQQILSAYLENTNFINGQSIEIYRQYSKPKRFNATIVKSTIINVNTEGQVVSDKETGTPEIGLLVIKNDTELPVRVRISEIVQH